MVQFTFALEFRHWVRRSRKYCVLCKAMSLIVYPAGVTVEVDEETARAAAQAGAGEAVSNSPGHDSL